MQRITNIYIILFTNIPMDYLHNLMCMVAKKWPESVK